MAFFKRWKTKPEDTSVLPDDPAERLAFEIGINLLETARRHPDAKGLKDKLADWAMRDKAFKVQLFRFVDTFPTLPDPASVHRHLLEYLSEPPAPGMALPTMPPGMGIGLKAGGMLKGAMSKTIASQISAMGGRYIAGTDAASAIPHLRERWQQGVAFSVDLLGEACLSEVEAGEYRDRYQDLIVNLAQEVKAWPANDRLEEDHIGPVPRANVSIKVSCLVAKFDPLDFDGSIHRCFESLAPLLRAAAEHNVLINFDVEQSELKDLNLALFMHCCEQIDFPAGLAMQAYLRSGDDDAHRVIDWANTLSRPITVRLVKGAYWDYEVIRAQEQGWPCPVWTTKRESDACFERMAKRFVENTPTETGKGGVKLALGSHNLRSIAATLSAMRDRGLPDSAVELQMLYGMANGPKQAVLEQGLRLREYVPVGEMIPGMAYLVRRLLENTSNESWLMKGFDQQLDPSALLASPHSDQASSDERVAEQGEHTVYSACEILPGTEGVDAGRPYINEPMRDFSEPAVRDTFAKAIQNAQVPKVENTSTVEQAAAALDEAHRAFVDWRDTDPIKRANIMVKVADILRQRRDELSGIIIKEAGKPWREADGDVCEAIDFCAYYARLAPSLFQPEQLGEFLGERNDLFYQPRGVTAVISPWNFPLAICAGMTVAALVTGNTAVVKPAEQTPGIASVLCDILWEAGVPREVLHFLPGPGETVGAALVRDPRVSVIAFTGSKAVGLEIIQAAGVTPEEQMHVKRVVCEMGGKNAVIIDSSADLDEAVAGVVYSAFGFAGQKCSACSRVICLDDVHDRFVERFVEATRALTVGDPIMPATDVGPVIDQDALAKVQHYIAIGRQEGKLELAMQATDTQAWGKPFDLAQGKPIIGPHIFSGIEPTHRLAREEVFGPVVAVMKASSFEEALSIANGTPYKLTGGVFSRTPSNLAQAREQFRVGNLYLNRGCTGALVGRQPFGGSGMSGVGSKAGGAQYLYQFVEPRCITENTMRRGFAPSLSD